MGRIWEYVKRNQWEYLKRNLKKITGWLARPKAVVSVILAGYFLIFIIWLIRQVIIPPQPPIAATAPATTGSQPQPKQTFFLKRFCDDAGPFLGGWSFIATIIFYFASHENKKWEDSIRLLKTQKERIRLLNNFEPTQPMIEFFDNRSIYNAIISMLDRLSKEPDEGDEKKICMLLCSPALDYWHAKSKSPANISEFKWGLEFRDLVKKLVVKGKGFKFHVCHLPFSSLSGVNVMKDFIAALSTYIIQDQFKSDNKFESDNNFQKVYDLLWQRAGMIAKDFELLSTDEDSKDRFKVDTHIINIPFQIVLVNSNDFTEVVVSFAGREVLEREQKYGVKGFFSSDPFVVKTFHEVFKTYVESRDRIPYIPPHTRKVAIEHGESKCEPIKSFYYGLVKELNVAPETFSPIIGNSSKFTVWLLDKLLTTGNPGEPTHWRNKIQKILDVGAGTGVLSLAAASVLRDRCNRTNYKIIAIDMMDPLSDAFKFLKSNCSCDKNIEVHPWTLCSTVDKDGEIERSWFENDTRGEVKIKGDFDSFDLIVGDLPFVHAQERTKSDLRFLDLDHQLHQALMWVVANTQLLAKNGLLVTAFSSLGGPEDIAEFERYIQNNSLQVIQRVEFYESGYMWMVYVLMKKDDYKTYGNRLWWKVLDAEGSKLPFQA